MSEMKPIKRTMRDFSLLSWDFGVDFNQIVNEAVDAKVRRVFAESPPMATLGDGLKLKVSLPLASDPFDAPEWEVTLAEIIADKLDEGCTSGFRERIAQELRELAERVEKGRVLR